MRRREDGRAPRRVLRPPGGGGGRARVDTGSGPPWGGCTQRAATLTDALGTAMAGNVRVATRYRRTATTPFLVIKGGVVSSAAACITAKEQEDWLHEMYNNGLGHTTSGQWSCRAKWHSRALSASLVTRCKRMISSATPKGGNDAPCPRYPRALTHPHRAFADAGERVAIQGRIALVFRRATVNLEACRWCNTSPAGRS